MTEAARPPGAGRRRWLWPLARWCLTIVLWAGIAGAGVIGWFAWDLPDIDRLAGAGRAGAVTLLAADGSTYASFGDLYGVVVGVAELPAHVPLAVMAVEDRRFRDHGGIDWLGVLRAALVNLRAGRIRQGGSTITQQVAKNLFLTPERSLARKIRESILAWQLESRFSKDEILTIYLNRVYFGAGTFGIDAAARRYFGRPATQLSLYQAAMIAGLLRAPSRYNPARAPDLAHRRAVIVLNAMVDAGYIEADVAERAARDRDATPAVPPVGLQRWFADWVLERLPGYVGWADEDLVVTTTLDPRLQRLAEGDVRAALTGPGRAADAGQAALVAMAPDGAVRAMVGGLDYATSQFNRATAAMRQPGSAFKPFVFLAALEDGLDPDDRIEDAPIAVGDWRPRNYGDNYLGQVTLREALARSLNSVAVRLTQRAGVDRVAATAHRLGIESPLAEGPALALGASEVTLLELTGAYASFARDGTGVLPHGIVEVRGRSGALLYRREGSGPGRVVGSDEVAAMNDMLSAVIDGGTGRAAALDRPAAGKTGTSQDFRDAWFVGYTAELVTGVWFGNDDGAAMDGVTGGGLPARLWRDFMSGALQGVPVRPLPGN